ncbi:rRNA methyltransferase 1, mitochondrial [Fulvia fulva]|uniref:rRNA methyltransferase 1, mitochondrial n=1 Tax=Passalora fulva TaxID=5499 RepID=A0A9Q8P8F4_PASFU|nr:rRNA methyltransferase 1, mitochondrial [Fulvia fulva]UJO17083.1 rRNA methyltransferase 1, mitochondrial [Fulvia fulva]WPV28652.1 rRNA methyltransferase 1, mitochondrial [Fulvia fulva]
MSSSIISRTLCLQCRISVAGRYMHPAYRAVSTSSAINRGLRASKDDGDGKRGGRDRSRPSTFSSASRSGSGRSRDGITSRRQSTGQREDWGPAFRRDKHDFPERTRSSYRDDRKPSFRRDDDRPKRSSSSSGRGDRGSAFSRDGDKPKRSFQSSDRDERKPFSRGNDSRPQRTSRLSEREGFRPRRSSDAQSAPDRDAPRFGDKGQPGILRTVKTACQLVQQMQEREANEDGVDHMAKEMKSTLQIINKFVQSGNFKDKPSEAIASLFEKKAPDGTFAQGRPQPSSRSVIYQGRDGFFDLSLGQAGLEAPKRAPVKSSRRESEDRVDRPRRDNNDPRSDRRGNPRNRNDEEDEEDEIPVSVPYTTAASQFLYGYNSVLAALRSKRRKLYRLYVHPKIFEKESAKSGSANHYDRERPAHEFVALAKEAGIPFRNEFKTALLDRMSDGRPHNGVVLEASRLPAPPVLSLGKPDARQSTIPLNLGPQNADDVAINGSPKFLRAMSDTWRQPLILLLDGITDPGNIGNIIRTAHFYGVDAVAVASNTCANLSSAVLAKASSGACEAVRLLSLPQPSNFAYDSARSGWKIYAAVAPEPGSRDAARTITTRAVAKASPLLKYPSILMLGAEGAGLRENLRNRADHFVTIEGGVKPQNMPDVGVDSLNVSVSAGVLVEAFLRKPANAPDRKDTRSELGW